MSIVRILLACALALSSAPVFADENATVPSSAGIGADGVAGARDATHFFVRTGPVEYHYEEPGLMKITGSLGKMFELGTGYRKGIFRKAVPMFYYVDFNIAASSSLNYDGGITDTATGVTTPDSEKSSDQIYHLQGGYGFTFINSSTQAIELSGGLAFWILRNMVGGRASYHREINQFFAHVDADYVVKGGDHFMFITGLQLNLLLLGTVKSKLSDVNSSYSDLNNTQTSGNGYKIHASFEFPTGAWTPYIDIYHRYWKIEDSDTTYATIGTNYVGFKEPSNWTHITGVNFGARF